MGVKSPFRASGSQKFHVARGANRTVNIRIQPDFGNGHLREIRQFRKHRGIGLDSKIQILRILSILQSILFQTLARSSVVLVLPSLAISAVTGIDVYISVLVMGLAIFAYLLDPAALNDQVVPIFVAQAMPVGMAGVIIAAIFAASMSTVPSPDLNQILLWREDLRLGRPIAARADIWSSYREAADGSWYDDPEKCPVAPIFRLGIYLINDLIRLVGKPVAVSVMSSRLFTGRPCVRNMRIAVSGVLGWLASGMTHQEILSEYPELHEADILACLAYVAEHERRVVTAA